MISHDYKRTMMRPERIIYQDSTGSLIIATTRETKSLNVDGFC